MKIYPLLLFVSALSPILAPAQTCTYLAYEAFDYPANVPLNGQSGGTGWFEPWLVQNADVVLPGYQLGNGGASQSVPEPSGLALVIAGAAALFAAAQARRRI